MMEETIVVTATGKYTSSVVFVFPLGSGCVELYTILNSPEQHIPPSAAVKSDASRFGAPRLRVATKRRSRPSYDLSVFDILL